MRPRIQYIYLNIMCHIPYDPAQVWKSNGRREWMDGGKGTISNGVRKQISRLECL